MELQFKIESATAIRNALEEALDVIEAEDPTSGQALVIRELIEEREAEIDELETAMTEEYERDAQDIKAASMLW